LEVYSALIEAGFAVHGIPTFIDRRRPITYHPLVELVRSAVRIISRDWPSEEVFHYLKTDLIAVDPAAHEPQSNSPESPEMLSREAVDELENYVLAHGIRGSRWRDDAPWDYRRQYSLGEQTSRDELEVEKEKVDVERINLHRACATAALKRFEQTVRNAINDRLVSVRTITEALYALLEDLRVPQTLERWAQELESLATSPSSLKNTRELASEHRQVWNIIVELFDDLVETLGDKQYTLTDYADILEAGLGALSLGLTPPKVDQVVVGSADRSRQPDLRAAFVLSLTESDFPLVRSEDAIFTDDERSRLKSLGIPLMPSTGLQLQGEKYLGYIAFTRAREYLWLSYSAADLEGKKKIPSPFISQILRCFPKLSVTRKEDDEQDLKLRITSAVRLAETLAGHLRPSPKPQNSAFWIALYNEAVQVPEIRDKMRHVLSSLIYRNAPSLNFDLVKEHFGDRLLGSVSALETYAACPFQHFSRYTLKLTPRDKFQIEPSDLGTLYHAALRSVVSQIPGQKISTLTQQEIDDMLTKTVASLVVELKGEILLSSSRNQHITSAVNRILRNLLRALRQADELSAFVPLATEIEFGKSPLPALRIDLGNSREMLLRGRIDRVDGAESETGLAARVLDYKMNAHKLELCDIMSGLDLQLIAYLLVLKKCGHLLSKGQPLEPVGAFYLPIQRKIKDTKNPKDEPAPDEKEYFASYKARGVFAAPYYNLLERSVQKEATFASFFVKTDGTLGNLIKTDPVESEMLTRIMEETEKKLSFLGN
ncbi:MAG TPA: PD-(D/E)XK nuclease family protein, partial [bacterium]|nr:PD-(D/E)XK nuclease family protein [bacterium]